jgi:AcrR family transcriptional regulator
LLQAARRNFGRRGYHGASLDEIAEEAGFSKGALYYNFGGKEGLFLALLEERLEQRVDVIRDAFETEQRASDAITEGARRYVDSLEDMREFQLLYFEFWAQAVRDPRFRAPLIARLREARHGVASILESWGEELGVASRQEAERLAIAVNAIALGFAVEKHADPDGVPDELLGEVLLRVFGH